MPATARQLYQAPTGCILVGVGERFIAKDGDRWFIMQNYDYEDREGYMGCSTEILGDPHGYETEEAAEAALAGKVAP
ncbi:MAG TPA: hypothetical protein VLJ17_15115 [Xanthobacteraceae bacterium]|nr:hypothetical protein [Xanthobacteraceae bacterium]